MNRIHRIPRILLPICLALLASLLPVAPLRADTTTGALAGHVLGPDGAPMPGVVVEVSSPMLQGKRSATADRAGNWRIALLPPGKYEVRAEIQGFEPVKKSVVVALGAEGKVDLVMQVAVTAEVSVTAAAPLVDSSSTRLGANLDEAQITALPTGRSYASVAQTVGGVGTDNANGQASGLTVYGSSGSENAYLIDGINTTNAEYGLQGKEMNFEFIQEVEVKTGGYEAEYGRSTGGIINVVTKSGGNEFHGDAFGYWDDDSLQAPVKHKDEGNAGALLGYTRKDFGLDLGGYLLMDKLWFFAAYDQVKNTRDTLVTLDTGEELSVPAETERKLSSAKLTWKLTEGISLVAAYIGDPTTQTGAILDANHGTNGDPSTFLGEKDSGGRDYSLRGEALVGTASFLTAQVSRHEEDNSLSPSTAEGHGIQYVDTRNGGYATGGLGYLYDKNFKRDFAGASFSSFFGEHSVKGGAEWQRDRATVMKTNSSGQQVFVYDNPGDPTRPVYEHEYWTTPDATVENAPISRLLAEPEHRNWTLYLQDRWTPLADLTISAGLRWDRQQIVDYSGKTVIDLDRNLAPRLGFVWTPIAGSKSRAYGSWGWFYEEIPMDLVIRSYSSERQPHIFNFDPVGVSPDPEAEAIVGSESNILGQAWSERSDPNLKGQHLEEIVLGWDQEIDPSHRVGVKYVYRRYKEVIEDFLCDPASGEYCIGNPGKGIMKEIYNENYDPQGYPAPEAQRQFQGVELDVEKRFEKGRLYASYLWSKLRGNYDGEFAPFTNVGPDPNISAAYDYWEFTINNRGYLSNDRRHQFKVSGSYVFPYNVEVGVSAYWKSGTPLTRMGFDNGYGRYEHFLTTRGDEGRSPSIYEADLHVGYPLPVGPVTANLLLDVFNLLNAQRPVAIDQRWDFDQNDNGSPTPTNANYGKPLLRQDPRSVRLGLRVSF